MAVAMRTYGSTLSDLQALTNADRALDYQRANFQDQINAQRLSDFLKSRSDEQRTQADRDANAAKLLDAQQGRAQQGRQFDKGLQSDRDLAEMEARNRVDVAKIQAENKGIDPRYFQSLSEIQALNNEQLQNVNYAKQLSNRRRNATLRRQQIEASKGFFDVGEPNDPEWKQLGEVIASLDAQATQLGLGRSPDGGFIVPEYAPIPVPAMLNPAVRPSAPPPGTGIQATPASPPVTSGAPSTPWLVDPESIPYGGGPVAPPPMLAPPSAAAPRDYSDPSMAGFFDLFRRAPASAPIAPYGPPMATPQLAPRRWRLAPDGTVVPVR